LLLDDMLGELDRRRRKALLRLVGEENQTVLTVTDREDLDAGVSETRCFVMESGRARRVS
jgi:recombinational DNA repair ATPase RecF